ncbi:uncharacterized protein [Dermacentor andersoni]|uniref:uncharacterized protein isoform X1 n=1 Tax=Dermacentor andersoni TaxID=34620 RepID=UPI002416B39A|nr:uncharacterized protein LOC126531866 isoform X1 [Dermacentor andersoni]
MSSVDSYSCGSQSTLSEETEQIWPRYVAGRQRERRLDCSECEAAAASRNVGRSGSSVPERRSRRTRGSSRPDSSLSVVNQYGVADTQSLIAGRSFSCEGDAPVPSVHWVRALCLALMALSSALFIGAVSLALMHSLPETWPTPPSRDAKVHGAASAANPSQDKAGQHPVVQDAARLEHAPKEHAGTPSVAAATTRTSTPTSAGTALPEGTDVQVTAIQPSARHEKPDRCQRVFYKFCLKPRREFFFNPAVNACVALSGRAGAEVCNRSPNRFLTAVGCSRQCVRTRKPAGKCLQTALLSTCGRGDVVNGSNLWFFHSRGCHLWSFPSGKCPSWDGQLFSSVGRCLDACVRRRAGSYSARACRTPAPATCNSRQLKFPFFAADFGESVALRCLPTSTAGQAWRRCLAGANRFRTRAACEAACVYGGS